MHPVNQSPTSEIKTPTKRTRPLRRSVFTASPFTVLFFVLVFVIIIFSDRGGISGDGETRWQSLHTLMEERRLDGGRFSLIQPILAIPLYVAGDYAFRLRTNLDPQSERYQEKRTLTIRKYVGRFNKFVVFLICLWFYFTLIRLFHFTPRQSAGATIFLLFGSMLIPNGKDFYSECLWTLLSLIALSYLAEHSFSSESKPGGLCPYPFMLSTALLIGLNPVMGVVFAGLFCFVFLQRMVRSSGAGAGLSLKRSIVSPLIIMIGFTVCLGFGLQFFENYLRRGDLLNYGYGGGSFSWLSKNFVIALIGQFVSPSRGILFFMPTVFLGFAFLGSTEKKQEEKGRELIRLSLLYSLIVVVFYSGWYAWHGASYWGPRFLLPLSIFGTLFFVVYVKNHWSKVGIWVRSGLIFLGFMSVVMYEIGAAIAHKYLRRCLDNATDPEMCYWNLENFLFSSLGRVADLQRIVTHRSILVGLIGCLGLWLLLKFDRWERNP
jgi:hypothetical protein